MQNSPRSRRSFPAKLTALAGIVALSVLAGVLFTAGATPAVVVTTRAAMASTEVFTSVPDLIRISALQQRNVLYANRGGKLVAFATLYSENRVSLKWDEVAQTLKDAVVAGEDRRYREHGAVDFNSLVRAAAGSIAKRDLGASGGGSTITMQLVRNILVNQAMQETDRVKRLAAYKAATVTTPHRKIAEMRMAIRLEKQYTKDEILLAYLNIAYFGDNAYGVEAASQHYFGKGAQSLSVAEAASLIAIVQYPESRNLGTPSHYAANQARRDVIIASMHGEKMIDEHQRAEAIATPVASTVHLTATQQGCMGATPTSAQQWCDLVQRTVTTLPALGSTPEERQRNWKLGGYDIHTTLDLDLNDAAKNEVDDHAPATETRYELGGSVVSIEAKTGRVLVMAQNKNFDNTEKGGGSATSALNFAVDRDVGGTSGFQPGSTYKVFTLLDWLKNGRLLSESVNATPRTFTPMTVCGSFERNAFAPKNDDGGNPGWVTPRQATMRSINTAFVAMAQKLDLCDIRDTAKSLGVHPASGGELTAVPASVIGSGDTIAPLTMASAFTAIANDGIRCAPVFIDSVVTDAGEKLPGQAHDCARVLESGVAAKAASALQGVFTGGTATTANPRDGIPIFGKTGTSDHAEQTWLVGGSTNVVTAAWVGNLTGHQNQYRIFGAHGAMNVQRLAIWRAVMAGVNARFGGEQFPAPAREYVAPRVPKPLPTPDSSTNDPPAAATDPAPADGEGQTP